MEMGMYWLPAAAVVMADMMYQMCARKMSGGDDPLPALFGSYLAASLLCVLLLFLTEPGMDFGEMLFRFHPAALVVGVSVCGLEAGSIYMYKNGWAMNTGFLLYTAAIVAILFVIGALFYGEAVTLTRLAGVVLVLGGMALTVNE